VNAALAGLVFGAGTASGSWWPFIVLLVPWIAFIIGTQAFMMRRSSKARAIPATAEYERFGFSAGHGVRYVGGVSASSTDPKKRCTYPLGEMLVDDNRLVLRVARGFAANRIDLPLEKSDVLRVTRGRSLWVPFIRFETVNDRSGKVRYSGNDRVFAQLTAFGWPTVDGASDSSSV
jgi:hypothetical protein